MEKRHFELVEGTSSKFWEVWVEGNEVRTRYGRIGANGQTTIKEQASPASAQALMDSLVAEKTKKGYLEKSDDSGGSGAAPATVASAKVAPAKPAPAKPATAKGAKHAAPVASADPSAHDGLLERIEAAAKKAGVALAQGATDVAIAAAEKDLGQSLPDDVKAFYRRHDGAEDEEAIEGRELLSLERMVGEWKIWKDLYDKGTFETNDHGEPGEGVQKRWYIPQWIPVTYDGSGNHHVIDLAPAQGGVPGQVLSFWHDEAARTVAGRDLLSWLADATWGSEDDDEDDEDDSLEGFRRFEVDEKFWAIRLDEDGQSFTVKFGKIGTEGQEKEKSFGDPATAKKEYDKLIAEKTKKGYVES